MPDRLKLVILDDNDERRYLIRDMLPDYIDAVFSPLRDNALSLIKIEASGRKTDLVIMNADDETGVALSLFSRMKSSEDLYRIPVLLLCEDAFSDRVLEFLEFGDAEFAEGELDPDLLFMQIMDMIDAAEMAPEDWSEPLYTVEKDPGRVQGLSLKPLGEDEDTIRRSIVLQHEEQLRQLDEAIERGRKKQEQIKELMALAVQYKEELSALDEMKSAEKPSAEAQSAEKPLHELSGESALKVLSGTEEEEPEEKKPTIVVVDYDVRNRKLCELFLQLDYKVVSITTGMGAIDYFVKSKADLMLLSTGMPILDGYKILDSIRWQPNGKRVPVLFMAEGDLEEERKKCGQKERVVGILSKPVTKTSLRRSVDVVLHTLSGSGS